MTSSSSPIHLQPEKYSKSLRLSILKEMKKQRVSAIQRLWLLTFEKKQVRATEQEMHEDFVERFLIPWYHVGKRKGLPKDIIKWIAKHYIPLHYVRHPVHEYLKEHAYDFTHTLIVQLTNYEAFEFTNTPDVERGLSYTNSRGRTRTAAAYGKILIVIHYYLRGQTRYYKEDDDCVIIKI